MKLLRIAVLLIILCLSAKAYPSEKKFPCMPAKKLMAELLINGYAYLATATADPNAVIQVYVDLNNGDWVLVGLDSDLQGCKILTGYGWQFALMKGA